MSAHLVIPVSRAIPSSLVIPAHAGIQEMRSAGCRRYKTTEYVMTDRADQRFVVAASWIPGQARNDGRKAVGAGLPALFKRPRPCAGKPAPTKQRVWVTRGRIVLQVNPHDH